MHARSSNRTDRGRASPARPSTSGCGCSAEPNAGRAATRAGSAQRTLVLAVLRGAMLDLLATGDIERTTDALELAISSAIRVER